MNKIIIVFSFFTLIVGCASTPAPPSPKQLAQPHLNRAEQFANSGEWQKSIAALNTSLEINPRNAYALADRGFAKYKAGLPMEDVLADANAALSINENAKLFIQRCDLRIIAKMYKDAIEDCNQAIRYAEAKGFDPDMIERQKAGGAKVSITLGHGFDEAYARLSEQAIKSRDLAREKMKK